jgi:hypothetical protein
MHPGDKMNRNNPDASRDSRNPETGQAATREQPAEPPRPRRPDAAVGRSFVVEVTPGPDAEAFRGRVQHLATHDGGNFTSVEMLVSIIRRVLGRAEPDVAGQTGED